MSQNLDTLISDEFPTTQLAQSKTGGSAGLGLTLYFDKKCQTLRDAADMRANRWSGWDLGERVGVLCGYPSLDTTLREKLRAALLDRIIYLDTVLLNDESMRAFAASLLRYHIRYLFGHAHSLFIFANFVRSQHITDLDIRGIVATSMVLPDHERQAIEAVLGCPITNRYASEEVGLIASECEQHRGLHLNTDHLYIEILRSDGSPCPPGEEGDIVITDLINRGMPLIRYRGGDRAIPSDHACPCGRGMPLVETITARTADCLIRRDGSAVAGVSLVNRTLIATPGLEELQTLAQDPTGTCRFPICEVPLSYHGEGTHGTSS